MTTALKLTDVILPGSGYPNIRDFVAPVFPHASGLVGLYTFGPRPELSLVNHANDGLPLIVHGTPASNSDGVTVSKLGYLDTQLPQTSEFTVISLCLPLLAASYLDGQLLFSNYKPGDATQGESVAFFGTASNPSIASVGSFLNITGNAVAAKPLAMPASISTTRHAAFAARVSLDGSTKVFVLDNGVLSAGASTAVARLPPVSRSMLIGPGYVSTSSWAGALTVKVLAVWHGALNDQQITDNLNYLATLYEDLVEA
ncbi:hypothetical protein [Pseudomonas ovata]|uniref:hypothetical protein n=1 Tax=Pseudomonas ovata TaxID=1839709 RepID=UPI0012602431|nr:hypothetical protein [Pseudomonas ovata]